MNQPILSIVICTYNRDKYLQKCLDHISAQSIENQQFEILVIDNASQDQTQEVCTRFQQQHSQLNFKVMVESRQGLSHCRNRGVRESAGKVISFLDDDAYADKDYAANLVDYFEKHPEVDAIGGKITPVYENGEPPWMSKYLLPLVAALDMGNAPKPFRGMRFPLGANMAFRRSVLTVDEPFQTNLGRKGTYLGSGEEKEFFFGLRRNRKIIHYVPQVRVDHFIPQHRLEMSYIKDMAHGIGKSEALRIKHYPFSKIAGKWLQEFFKIGATAILAILYLFTGKWVKAKMLVRFRIWLFGSFIKG